MKAKLNRLALLAQRTQAKQKAVLGAIGGAVLMASSAAHAELPPEVTAAFDKIKTDFADLATSGWGVVAAVTGGLILLKLFKKFANRAT